MGSCVAALLAGINDGWTKPPAEWLSAIVERKTKNIAKLADTLAKDPTPMNFHSALNVVRDIVKANPDAILVNEGANALDFTRSIVDMYKPRKRLDVGTWGIMGIGMGFAVAAAVETGESVIAIEGDSAFGFSGMEVETICRYNLPVCVVIFNNNGVYRGTDVNPTGGADVAHGMVTAVPVIARKHHSLRINDPDKSRGAPFVLALRTPFPIYSRQPKHVPRFNEGFVLGLNFFCVH
jgi:oxalyl-CoA decarboxylase